MDIEGTIKDYEIVDPICACVDNAKFQLTMLNILLSDGAKEANKVIKEFVPKFASKQEYLNYLDSIACSGERIDYSNGKIVSVNIK